jgi:hypothetical protein
LEGEEKREIMTIPGKSTIIPWGIKLMALDIYIK